MYQKYFWFRVKESSVKVRRLVRGHFNSPGERLLYLKLVSEFLRVNWPRTLFGWSSQEFVEGAEIKYKETKESSMNPSFELKTDLMVHFLNEGETVQ